ncbi:hypothetical protein JOF53_006479 [Crossiella equi]|uniref:Uncharacterized protein n=1 Tax=Crossiella equi TaxID=130796 RepID=A0ABS5AM12_9PSEU|nr:hypothetical protein [Crossiella equi]MBP2477607.1 hypothetical protein [Crossiella equi]
MKVGELDKIILDALLAADHPEIDTIEVVPTPERPNDHNRLKITMVNGYEQYLMVQRVAGPGVPPHPDYELPKGAV